MEIDPGSYLGTYSLCKLFCSIRVRLRWIAKPSQKRIRAIHSLAVMKNIQGVKAPSRLVLPKIPDVAKAVGKATQKFPFYERVFTIGKMHS